MNSLAAGAMLHTPARASRDPALRHQRLWFTMVAHDDPTDRLLRAANVDLARRFIDAINDSWNIGALRELIAEDFVFEVPFAPEWFPVRCEGREAALAFLDGVRKIMEPENLHALTLDTYATDPGELIAQYRSDTRILETRFPYRNEYVARFTVRDGRIKRFVEYLDPIRYVLAIGGRVDPPPGFADARI